MDDVGSGGRVGRWCVAAWLVHAVAAGLGVRYPGLFGYRAVSPFSDPDLFQVYARLIARGSLPFLDFTIEYPPLAIPFFVLPLLAAAPLVGRLGDREAYYATFAGEMLLVDAVAVVLVARVVARSEGAARVPGRLAWYTACFVALCPLIVARFDLVPMLAAFAAAVALGRGRPRLGGVIAGLGVLAKGIPGLVIVPLLAGSLPREPKARAAGWLTVVTAAGALGAAALGGEMAWNTVGFHLERLVEINTTYAGAYMVAHRWLGVPLTYFFNHSCLNIVAPGSRLLARLAVFVQLAGLALVAWRARRGGRPYSIRLAGAAILAYIIGGKVLSPQYLIWLMPFVVVAGPGRGLFLACCVLTTATYPWYFGDLCNFGRTAEALLLARNLGLIWLFVLHLRADPVESPGAGPWTIPPSSSKVDPSPP